MSKILTREEILGASDTVRQTVSVPEWGGEVLVRNLSGEERDAFEESILSTNSNDARVNRRNIRAKLVAACACDAEGNRLFSDKDVVALGRKSGHALDRVFSAASKLNGLSKNDVDELAKNSAPDPSDSSTSD